MTPGHDAGRRLPARKIHPPLPPAQHVQRERVVARVDAGALATPVTLLSAPTGYGKSTLLSAWASTASETVAWLTLDELDDDADSLWHGILASIGSAVTTAGRTDVDLGPVPAPGAGAGVGTTVDEALSRLDDLAAPLVLVLDNVDLVRSPAPRALLDRLLRYAPTHLHLVLAARYDPPLALRRLRTAGELTELRHGDLRFSELDVHTLAELSDVALSPTEHRDLHRATAGWPVAVKMALVALAQNGPEQTLTPLLRPTSPVADLLVADMLDSLGPELSEFVLRATTCRTVDARLADTLNGGDDGARLLAECVDRGLFLDRLPECADDTPTYRWHDFFAAQCQATLAARSPQAWRALHRSAAQHWEHLDLDEAVSHALRGGRPALAARFLQDRWIELVLRGEHHLLLTLCHRIPPPLDETPELLLLVAVCQLLDDDPTQADLTLRRARATAGAHGTEAPSGDRFTLLERLLRTVLADGGTDLLTTARTSHALLTTTVTPQETVATAGAEYLVGRMLGRAEQTDAALTLLDAARGVALARSMTALRLACDAERALLLGDRDGCGTGRTVARAVLDEAAALGWQGSSTAAPASLALARWHYEHDDLPAAREHAEDAQQRTADGDAALRALVQGTLLEVALAGDEPAGAEQLHETLRAGRDGPGLPPSWPAAVTVLDARWLLASGDVDGAARTVVDLPEAAGPVPSGSLVWAGEVLRQADETARALALLDRVPRTCRATHVLVAHRLVGTLLAAHAGDTDSAHLLLERALALAEGDDVRRPFVDRAAGLRPLLSDHLGWGTAHTSSCVALLDHLPSERAAPQVPSYWSLTPREHEVLLYLRTTMTAADIASAVFVSVNTVKTHQRAIYRKLGVEGRREAVRVAADRGLL